MNIILKSYFARCKPNKIFLVIFEGMMYDSRKCVLSTNASFLVISINNIHYSF